MIIVVVVVVVVCLNVYFLGGLDYEIVEELGGRKSSFLRGGDDLVW